MNSRACVLECGGWGWRGTHRFGFRNLTEKSLPKPHFVPVTCPNLLPRPESAINCASRRARVSSCFALTTHQVAVRR
jgi:hypothetical protein